MSSSKKLSAQERIFEYIMLGLRLEEGINVSDFNNEFGVDFLTVYCNIIERLQKQYLVYFD